MRSCLMLFLSAALLAAAPAPARDPLDARAPVPAASYRSAFAGYRGAASTPASAIPWRAANDEVARIGGWRAYAREAAASGPAAAASTPAPAPHRH
jgi:hypothetical protein